MAGQAARTLTRAAQAASHELDIRRLYVNESWRRVVQASPAVGAQRFTAWSCSQEIAKDSGRRFGLPVGGVLSYAHGAEVGSFSIDGQIMRQATGARWFMVVLLVLLPGAQGCEVLRTLIESVTDGAACRTDGTCLGGICLGEEEGFPGGYCSTLDCETAGCSSLFGAECLASSTLGTSACFRSCEDNGGCRTGYACLTIETQRVCLPRAQSERYPEAGTLGSACAFGVQCQTETCLTNFPGGYCSTLGCRDDDACGASGVCRSLEGEDGENALAETACFRRCSGSGTCRFGYTCVDATDGAYCAPQAPEEVAGPRNPAGLDDGLPCTVGLNCKGGTCLRAEEGYPGGYCTTLDCASLGCNGENARCRTSLEEPACFASCAEDGGCRVGYACLETGAGNLCLPAPDVAVPTPDATPPPVSPPNDPLARDLRVSCVSRAISGGRAIEVEIAPEAVSFAIVPYVTSGQLRPQRLLLPNGSVGADFNGDYKFLSVNADILFNITPTFFPASPAFQSIVQQGGGRYTLEVTTRASEVCWFLVQQLREGSNVDLNFYLVGVPNLNAANASTSQPMRRMLEVFRAIYARAGIQLREVRYIDVAGTNLERFRIIRSFNELYQLVAISEAPGSSRRERLSVNVFMIQGFAVPQAPGLLGASMGIPGVPGEHGNTGAGLVFTSEYLARDPAMMGQTLAHEVGHYLGLRHTSEHGGATWDPIDDTPQCSNPERGARCPDAQNFMFPFSLSGVTQEQVSAGQAFVLRRAPWVQ